MSGRILGAVLAGGASSRFGSDKALAVMEGRTLLDRARALLAPWAEEVIVVGRDGGVADAPVAGLGPLGGIAGALGHGARHGFGSVLTIACDMPIVADALLAQLAVEAPAYCRDAPVLGHWPCTLADALLGRLSHDDRSRSVRCWASDIGAVAIDSPVPLTNINTPADLAIP